MTDDPQHRLQALGQSATPSPDPDFVDGLESQLRVEHAAQAGGGVRRQGVRMPRLMAGLAVAAVAMLGVFAAISDDPSVPIAVVDDGTGQTLADAAPTEGDNAELSENVPTAAPTELVVATPTPTATPTRPAQAPVPLPTIDDGNAASTPAPVGEPSTTPSPSVEPSTTAGLPTPIPPVTPTSDGEPIDTAQTATPTPFVGSQDVPTSTPTTVPPVSTPAPAPTATPTAIPSRPATPEPLPTATPEREPESIELTCQVRQAGDAVGVVCSWPEPSVDVDIAGYQLQRSRNGGDAQVISRQRAGAERTYVDRAVAPGDRLLYLIQGLGPDESVVASSVRQEVAVPE